MTEIIYREESYQILGACFEVYKHMGCGFSEAVYQECLQIEFGLQNLPCQPHVQLSLSYKGNPLRTKFIPDFILFDKIVVELKSVSEILDEHRAQVFNYLRATRYHLGLLVNFGHHPQLQYQRIVI